MSIFIYPVSTWFLVRGEGESERKMLAEKKLIFLSILLIGLCNVAASAETLPTGPLSETKNATDVDRLLSQMTISEKLAQLNLLDSFAEGNYRPEHPQLAEQGLLGGVFNVRGARITNELQRYAVAKSRLGIPILFAYDVLHGYRTVFPIPLALTSTWNPEAIEKAARISAQEARAAGIKMTFAPMLDISRDPRWGRIAESPGEDPYLASIMATAWVKGFQGEKNEQPSPKHSTLVACAKHWVAYGAGEGGRDYNTADPSIRTLREIYFPPFRSAVEAGAGCIMGSANEISGIPAIINHFTLKTVLREEWHFPGVTVSDFNGLLELLNHGVAGSELQAAELGLKAGLDLDMVSGYYFSQGEKLLQAKTIPPTLIDDAVRRVLRLKESIGLFDNPYVDETEEEALLFNSKTRQAAQEIAAQSLVLLKNENNLLPLTTPPKSLAVIGPMSQSKVDLLGPWSADGQEKDVTSLKDAIQGRFGSFSQIISPLAYRLETAVDAAKQAHLAIIAIGEPRSMSGEAASRTSLDLPDNQLALLQTIHALGKPYIVVIFSGRPLAITWLAEHSPAIIQAWYPGTMGAQAIADVISGDVNPSGKLPLGIPRSVGQIPLYYNHKNTGRPYQENNKYSSRYLDQPNSPLYPFGFGLSYTQFHLSNLRISASSLSLNDPSQQSPLSLQVEVDLTNTGTRPGSETVQLYLSDLVSSVTRPVRELKAFQKTELQPGEKKAMHFTLSEKSLAFYDQEMKLVVEPGVFRIGIGTSSLPEIEGEVTITE